MRKVHNAVAWTALFFSLGGTAIAARHYLLTSTSQIKPSVLKQLHGKIGETGPAGTAGPTGPQGPAGPSNLSELIEVASEEVFVGAGKVGSAAATCPTGQHAVSGGGAAIVGAGGLNVTQMSKDHQSWFVITNNEGSVAGKVQAVVLCAGAGQAVAARTNTLAHARAVREAEVLASKLRTMTGKTS
jgi:hypothetical protein